MAQPTVARRIETLEHVLGLVLFERNTKGFNPTQDALALMPNAEAIEKAAEELDAMAARLVSKQNRAIRITAVANAFNPKLSAILEGFIESYGDVKFELLPSDDTIDIAAGDADVAIRWTNRDIDDPSLICRKLASEGFSLFASKSYAAKSNLPRSDRELDGHKYLVLSSDQAYEKINDWLLPRIDSGQIAMTCQDFRAMESAIQMGAGIGPLLTRFMRTDETLVQCFELPEDLGANVWLLANPSAYRRPEVKAFTTYFAPRYSAHLRTS